jgi:hypothetical protein
LLVFRETAWPHAVTGLLFLATGTLFLVAGRWKPFRALGVAALLFLPMWIFLTVLVYMVQWRFLGEASPLDEGYLVFGIQRPPAGSEDVLVLDVESMEAFNRDSGEVQVKGVWRRGGFQAADYALAADRVEPLEPEVLRWWLGEQGYVDRGGVLQPLAAPLCTRSGRDVMETAMPLDDGQGFLDLGSGDGALNARALRFNDHSIQLIAYDTGSHGASEIDLTYGVDNGRVRVHRFESRCVGAYGDNLCP